MADDPTEDDAPPRPRRARSTKLMLAERIDAAEDMMRAGVTDVIVKRQLVQRFGCSQSQAERYVQAVNQRWREQSTETVPFRRERVYHMAEGHYAKAMAEKAFGPASSSLKLLAQMSGALVQHDPRRIERLRQLGPAPTDPGRVLQYARQLLAFEIEDVAHNDALDPEKRLRWISELSGRLGMLYARSEVEGQLREVEDLLQGRRLLPQAADVVDAKSIGWAETPGREGDHRGPRPLPGPGDGPGDGQGPDDADPEGGR